MKRNLQENIDAQLSPDQVEEFLIKAAAGHDMALESVLFSSQQVLSSQLDVKNPSGVHFKLVSGNLIIQSSSDPALFLSLKLRAITGAYIGAEDPQGKRGALHLEYGRTEVILEFTVKIGIQEILNMF